MNNIEIHDLNREYKGSEITYIIVIETEMILSRE